MKKRDFGAALREADATLDAGISPGAGERIRRRLLARDQAGAARASGAARWWPAAAAIACAGALVALWQTTGETPGPPPAARVVAGFAVTEASPDLALAESAAPDGRAVEVTRGACTLIDDASGSRLAVRGRVKLLRSGTGLRVVRGGVDVSVTPRPVNVARFLVSGGHIEVLGTRFSINQDADGGRVDVTEGRVRFTSTSGIATEIGAGGSHAWSEAAPAAVPAPSPPADEQMGPPRAGPPASGPPEQSIEQVLDRVAELRSRGLFAEAARELRGALRAGHRPAARERLGYELGSILTHQMADRARACSHWRAYRREFGPSRYEHEVDQAVQSLGCR